MRLATVAAADHPQAMAEIRERLGDDAIIVATQELKDGTVRITAATGSGDPDLAAIIGTAPSPGARTWFAELAEHHEMPAPLKVRIEAALPPDDTERKVALGQALGGLFAFRPLAAPPGRPLLLVGLPGAGKTASIAKLAGRAALAAASTRVLTADLGRAAGAEQLDALLAPLGIEAEPVADRRALRATLENGRADWVLIDSPGINPFRSADLGLLSGLIEASRAEPVLVLPSGLGVRDSADVAQTFFALGARRLLISKVDLTRRLGGVLAAADLGLAFSEAGIGPIIGNGLVPLSAQGLGRLLLHCWGETDRPTAKGGKSTP